MTTLTCDDCQATVPRLSSQQKRCRSCGVEAERRRQQSRDRSVGLPPRRTDWTPTWTPAERAYIERTRDEPRSVVAKAMRRPVWQVAVLRAELKGEGVDGRCVDCGARITLTSTARKRCDLCAEDRNRELRSANHDRSTGAPMECIECGEQTWRKSPTQKRCRDCAADREHARIYERDRRKAPSVLTCAACGPETPRRSSTQKRCPPCAQEHNRGRKRDPEYLGRKAELQRERRAADPVYRERQNAILHDRRIGDPVYRERQSRRRRELRADPEYRERENRIRRERRAAREQGGAA